MKLSFINPLFLIPKNMKINIILRHLHLVPQKKLKFMLNRGTETFSLIKISVHLILCDSE